MENSSQTNEITIGSLLGGSYKITGLLGKGGMGTVWAAQHLRLPKQVAVKVLHGAAATNPEVFARFRREAEIASRLGHANIVDVLDFNLLEDGTPYLILELLKGESLGAKIDRGPVSLEQTIAITRQIAAALLAAHNQRVVHRDLKPENVFLCPRESDGAIREHVKVLDFGISKIRGSQTVLTQTSTVLGTPQYMAPEQAAGKHDLVDGRTDQFALAAIVCEMLSGEPMFAGDTIAEVVFKVVYEPLPPLAERLPKVPDNVYATLERALSKEPSQRFSDMSEFVRGLSGKGLATMELSQANPPPTQTGATDPLAGTMASGDHGAALVAVASTMASGAHQPVGMAQTIATGDHAEAGAQAVASVAAATAAGEVNKSRGKKIGWIVAAIVVASSAATAAVMALGKPSAPTHAVGHATPIDATTVAAVTQPDATPMALSQPDAEPKAEPEAEPKHTAPPTPEHEEKLPANLVAEFELGTKAIDEENWSAALTVGRRLTRTTAGKDAGYEITFLAHCGQRKLGDVNKDTHKLRGLSRKKKRRLALKCRKLFPDYSGSL